ncbi:FAD-binding molybdopterin dehydrogenase [Starkeya sp. ORNL1]|uniref:FAD binding domain-containing protein n=1 Tax=Starkeya sp. ORNL1 TaxID=2709380 RepID=UPI0014644809|nr:FAD binding domain-containing protein [Starkeya sp. ORNL1]QJP14185.1 FAD-binding molybdopterin dehydrogenase [Starkeya sp. ORNL1]
MDINTIRHIERPRSADDVTLWRDGLAWLSGGTWLFSEPQPALDTLIDLRAFDWPALTITEDGLDIAATARIAELDALEYPAAWTAGPLFPLCCRALLMSFKIAHEASVGGNICMSLPAGAMISLTTALEGIYTLQPRDAAPRQVAAIDFVTGNRANVLAPGELLRSIHLPAAALTRRFAFRRSSLTHLGRSAALLIGTSGPDGDLLLTITASTFRPVQLGFPKAPSAADVRRAIDAAIPQGGYFDDVNGLPAYRRHLTYHFAEQIRAELAGGAA